MTYTIPRSAALVAGLMLGWAALAHATEISPHRALYSLSLASSKAGSGVVDATGAMIYEWGETCDAWTVQQRFRLRLVYEDADPVELSSTLVSWESKDGLRYRFNERRLRNGEPDEEVKGEARLDGPDKGGKADFSKPDAVTMTLAPKVLFPTAHTLVLIERAMAGDNFLSREVFDGATEDNASQISAVIGPRIDPTVTSDKAAAGSAGKDKDKVLKSPLIERPSWRVRLAFFPADKKADEPDYELGMRLFDNGVSGDMSLDYSDYIIRAKLDEIEPLSKPAC
ncbi:MAG TPA: cell envelope integrity EipB family protein [Stellaceae bacterium]|nr:cell envelope integrity EipB family protein [Stellaceae bacterium]